MKAGRKLVSTGLIASAINPVTMENIDDSCLANIGKPCIALPSIDILGCQQKDIGHKEDKGESMIHVLYIQWYAKKHFSG